MIPTLPTVFGFLGYTELVDGAIHMNIRLLREALAQLLHDHLDAFFQKLPPLCLVSENQP